MSKSINFLAMVSVLAAVTACARPAPQEEYVVVEPEPISMEPMHTGKYK